MTERPNKTHALQLTHSERLCLLLALVLLGLMLSGCAQSRLAPAPSQLSVNITDECGKLPGMVPPPAIDEKTDYRTLSAEALAALNLANRRNGALRNCHGYVIDQYAKAK